MEYKVVFSKRKTIAISIVEGVPIIKAPIGTNNKVINEIIEKHANWIDRHVAIQKRKATVFNNLTEADIKRLKKEARVYFTNGTAYYAKIMGLDYGRIKITSAQKRFGSCSSAGNISFSYRLMLYPEAAREYVIVHELAHRKEMNHSKAFYAIIANVLPDYKIRKRLLKEIIE